MMAIPVRVIERRQGDLPRSCSWSDGRPKVQYRHRRAARRAARAVRLRTDGVHAYRCDWGAHWHVGHRPSWKAAAS